MSSLKAPRATKAEPAPKQKPAAMDFDIPLNGVNYRLRFSLAAMMALRDRWKCQTMADMNARLAVADAFDFPDIFWAAMRTHHPELTWEQCLGIADDLGVSGLEAAVAHTISAASPEEDETDPKAQG